MSEFSLTSENLEAIHSCIVDLETIHEGRALICGDILTPNDMRRFLMGVMHQLNAVWCAANGLDRTAYENQSVMAREIRLNQLNAMVDTAKATIDAMSTEEFEEYLIAAGGRAHGLSIWGEKTARTNQSALDKPHMRKLFFSQDLFSDDIGDPFNCCPANTKD